MLALADDAALARLAIAATRIPRRARSRSLRDIASRIDPARIPARRAYEIEITNVRITDVGREALAVRQAEVQVGRIG